MPTNEFDLCGVSVKRIDQDVCTGLNDNTRDAKRQTPALLQPLIANSSREANVAGPIGLELVTIEELGTARTEIANMELIPQPLEVEVLALSLANDGSAGVTLNREPERRTTSSASRRFAAHGRRWIGVLDQQCLKARVLAQRVPCRIEAKRVTGHP